MPSRRDMITGAGGLAAAAASGLAFPALAQARAKVVVIGGGSGGVTVVRRLAARAGDQLDITLVEPKPIYTTCFYSNLYLGGFFPLDALQHDYALVAKLPGVTLAADRAAAIDRDRREIRLESGATLPYDRLVVSPGVELDYASVPGWSKEAETLMPHAWQAGEQTGLLKKKLDAVPDGGLIVMIAPPNPYRCPPGPYERVSMMAHALKSTGRGQARIVILDPKEKFSAAAVSAGVGAALSWHDRVAAAGHSWRCPKRASFDDVDRDRFRNLSRRRSRECHPGADSGTDRQGCRARR
ncbi:MAG: FAD/NAD(P)-binding oxidoreductase [Alphaproteobacteria bacterium]